MFELILVRHGETASNKRGTFLGWTDIELDSDGIKQAECAADKLKELKVDAIYASPLKRTAGTASIINRCFNLDVIYSDCLKERNFGIWDNLTFNEIKERYPDECSLWMKDMDYCMKDGETAAEASARVTGFIDALVKKYTEGRVIVVTHLGCIRNIIAYLSGLPVESSWHFRVGNGSLSRFVITDGYAVLTLLNG